MLNESIGFPWRTHPQVDGRRLLVRIFFFSSSLSHSNFNSSLRESDATIVTTSYDYESSSLDAIKQWYSDMQKEVHVLGPLLPFGFGTEPQSTEEGASVAIETFLGQMLLQHGKRSVFFVRYSFFGVPITKFKKFSDLLWHSLLASSPGVYRRVDRSPD
jgi:hypothetical protein